MTKIHKFYTNLYDRDRRDRGSLSTNECLSNISTKVLTDEQRRSLDDKISSISSISRRGNPFRQPKRQEMMA